MKKCVITGRGLVTPLGNNIPANLESLRSGRSGITAQPDWLKEGLDSCIAGRVVQPIECPVFDRKKLRFMPLNAQMAVAAGYEAMLEAGYTMETLPGDRMAVIVGCAGSSYSELTDSVEHFKETRNLRRSSPFAVPRIMPSSAVANLSIVFGIKGESYDISCACTSGAVAIITAIRLIRSGEYDIVMAGGAEETSWQQALGFNVMRALSHSYNDTPEKASRPFDKNRDGFVIADGAGIVIIESEEHARARGARIISELSGYASNSNACDMVAPNQDSSLLVMKAALRSAGLAPADIGYINTHGTSTVIGDVSEMEAIKELFAGCHPVINSTKSMTGHAIGAAGAMEAIFCSLMLEHGFVSPSLNLEEPEESFAWADFVRETRKCSCRHALSNSFGFGGSNASLVISRGE